MDSGNLKGFMSARGTIVAVAVLAAIISSVIMISDGASVSAEEGGRCGDNTIWSLNKGVLTISLTEGSTEGSIDDYEVDILTHSPWYDFRDSITTLVLPSSGLTAIGNCAFYDCYNISGTLILKNSIKKIGDHAFEGCKGITVLKMENSKVSGLYIGDYAFANCSNMGLEGDDPKLEITAADYIGSYAFYRCSSLTGHLQSRSTEYGEDGYTYAGCTGFTSVFLAMHQKSGTTRLLVPTHAFYECTGLKKVSFEKDRMIIGEYAFAGCTNITGGLFIPVTMKGIYANAFAGCTNILLIQFEGGACPKATDAFPSHGFYKDGQPVAMEDLNKGRYSGPDSLHLSFTKDESMAYARFDADGGSLPAPIKGQMSRGVKFPLPPYFGVKEHMRFAGWSHDDEVYLPGDLFLMSGGDVYFKAIWTEEEKYDVTFDLDGGSGTVPQQHGYEGDPIVLPSYDGTKDGFDYRGWIYNDLLYFPNETVTIPDGDLTIFACWSALPTHTVSYDIDGGSGNAPRSREMVKDTEFLLPGYKGVKPGCVFMGWLYGGIIYDPGEKFTMEDGDVAFIARWIPVHSVYYDIAGGSGDVPETEVVPEGKSFAVAECTAYKEGFRFSGWSNGNKTFLPGDGITMGISNITLTAVWMRGSPMHSVFYDADGGSGQVPFQDDVEEGSSFIVKMYSGTKDGYVFGGWSYDDKVYDTGDRITMGKSDIMLTAVWNEEGSFLDGSAITIICAAAAGIVAVCAVVFCIMRHY